MTPPFRPESSSESAPDPEDDEHASQERAQSVALDNERPAQVQIDAAIESLHERLTSITRRAKERLREEGTITINGREWSLEEIPDAYLSPAFAQKRYEVLQEEIENIREENEQAAAGSDAEAQKYFELQVLVPIVDLAEISEERNQLAVMIQQNNPGLFKKVFDVDMHELPNQVNEQTTHE